MKEDQIFAYGDRTPKLHETVFVAPGAKIVGRVKIGEGSSVWYNVVIRGDVDEVTIGAGTNIQDGAVLHQDKGFPLAIGNNVTVGHNAIVHGSTVGDGAVIGMGSIVMSGAKIGDNSVLGAGSVLPQGKEIPANSLAMGSPARVVRRLSEEEVHNFGKMARLYKRRAEYCRAAGDNPDF